MGVDRGATPIRTPPSVSTRDLVQRMLEANGYAVGDPVAREGEEREVVATYLSARETAERAELGAASRSEVQQATEDLRSVLDGFLRQAGLEPG